MADVEWETSSADEDLVSAAQGPGRQPQPPAAFHRETSVAVSVAGPPVQGGDTPSHAQQGGRAAAATAAGGLAAQGQTTIGPAAAEATAPVPPATLGWADDSDEDEKQAQAGEEAVQARPQGKDTATRSVPSPPVVTPPPAQPVTWADEEEDHPAGVAPPGQHALAPSTAAVAALAPPLVVDVASQQRPVPGGAVGWADEDDDDAMDAAPAGGAEVTPAGHPVFGGVGWASEDEEEDAPGGAADVVQPPAAGASGWASDDDVVEEAAAAPAVQAHTPGHVGWASSDDEDMDVAGAGAGAATTTPAAAPVALDLATDDEDAGGAAAGGDGGPDDNDDSSMDAQPEGCSANDSQCALCDDGGDLLLCEGVCMRSFHADPDGVGGSCLGMTADEFAAITASTRLWVCPACQTGRHACALCRKVGTLWAPPQRVDDPQSVFHCSAYGCSRFYHLACSEAAQAALQRLNRQVERAEGGAAPAAGTDSLLFTCKAHLCASPGCGNRMDTAANPVIPCRRCPQGYHVACIPPAILGGPRVWLNQKHAALAGLDPGQVQVSASLIYCERHIIPPGVQVPEHEPLLSSMTEAQRRAGTGPACRVLTEDVLHAAAQLSAAATGEATRCLGCSVTVEPPPLSGVELQGAAAAAAQVAQGVLDAARRDPRGSVATIRERLKDHLATQRRKSALLSTVPRTVTAERLRELENYFELLQRGQVVMPEKQFTDEVRWRFKQLRGALNPFLEGPRYTTYGRHFTRPRILSSCASSMALFMRHGDCVIDSSCGANHWLAAVSAVCAKHGIQGVSYRAFDLFPAPNKQPGDATVADWFTVDAAQLRLEPHGPLIPDRLVMGLNPPFGFGSAQAQAFIQHMASFRPRLIILIVPQTTELPLDQYTVLVRNTSLCAGHCFYLPGSHAPAAGRDAENRHVEDWNRVAPAFLILQRTHTVSLWRPGAEQGPERHPGTVLDSAGTFWRVRN